MTFVDNYSSIWYNIRIESGVDPDNYSPEVGTVMKCLALLVVSLFCLGASDALLGAWDDNLVYQGGNVDYLLVRPNPGEVRISGGGVPEWKQFFRAGGFDNGPNGIPENGGGDDIFLGVLREGVTWSTSLPPEIGRIKPSNGALLAGDQTGEGTVTATYPGATPATVGVLVYPPDWVPGSGLIQDDPGEMSYVSQTSPMGGIPAPESESIQIRNFPNPFNPSTTFSYRVPAGKSREVSLEIYTLRGQRVATLVDKVQGPGDYQVQWDGKDSRGVKVSSGIFLYRLRVDRESLLRKMTIVK
jgi:hypothetical protein